VLAQKVFLAIYG